MIRMIVLTGCAAYNFEKFQRYIAIKYLLSLCYIVHPCKERAEECNSIQVMINDNFTSKFYCIITMKTGGVIQFEPFETSETEETESIRISCCVRRVFFSNTKNS